jgi:hypothetical protein
MDKIKINNSVVGANWLDSYEEEYGQYINLKNEYWLIDWLIGIFNKHLYAH